MPREYFRAVAVVKVRFFRQGTRPLSRFVAGASMCLGRVNGCYASGF
ncbi:MAG: hypothetical protein WBD40_16750 [Tepidisphaeraceae bacterium]